MLHPVPGVAPARRPRRQQQSQGRRGDAVDGDRPIPLVRRGDGRARSSSSGRSWSPMTSFDRAPLEVPSPAGELQAAGDHDPLGHVTAWARSRAGGGVGGRRGIGDPGDPDGQQPRPTAARSTAAPPSATAVPGAVAASRPRRRQPRRTGGVVHPDGDRSPASARRAVPSSRRPAVVLVVADHPHAGRALRGGPAHGGVEPVGTVDVADVERVEGRGHRQQVEVVVVEPGQHGPAVDVERRRGARRRQVGPDGRRSPRPRRARRPSARRPPRRRSSRVLIRRPARTTPCRRRARPRRRPAGGPAGAAAAVDRGRPAVGVRRRRPRPGPGRRRAASGRPRPARRVTAACGGDAGERVGDGVGQEARARLVPGHEPARRGGVVAEGDPLAARLTAVAGDRHPHLRPGASRAAPRRRCPTGAGPGVGSPRSRRRPRRAGAGSWARPWLDGRSRATDAFPRFSRVEEARVVAPGPVGATVGLHLDHPGPVERQEVAAQRAGPQRAEVDDQWRPVERARPRPCRWRTTGSVRLRRAPRHGGDGQAQRDAARSDQVVGRRGAGRVGHGRPRVVGIAGEPEPGRHRCHVVGPGQVDGQPAVGGVEQPGAAAAARRSSPCGTNRPGPPAPPAGPAGRPPARRPPAW